MKGILYRYLLMLMVTTLLIVPSLYAQDLQIDNASTINRDDWRKPDYQPINQDDFLESFRKQPSFGIYHDNYIITGAPTNKEFNRSTADIKFQVSIRQLLLKNLLPRNHILALTYTQKSFWNIYEYSAPFDDNNYNPGLALTRPIIYKGTLRGITAISLEHESNGKDSLDNRSSNYVTLSGIYFFNKLFSTQVKVWAGLLADENKDLYSKYRGFGLIAMNYRSRNDVIGCSVVISPRDRFRSYNTQIEISFKPNNNSNQYLFLQWYNGYGEGLSDYDQYTSMIRLGICLKPTSGIIF